MQLEHSEVEIKITLPFAEFEPHIKRASVLISEEIEIDGFRRGRAPYDAVRSYVGESAIYERAADSAVRKTWTNVFDRMTHTGELSAENPLIGRPEVSVTKLTPGNELQFTVKSAALPPVKLPLYRTIAQRIYGEKREISVDEKEVNDALNWLCDSRTKLITVNREVKNGDRVEVDFEMRQGGVKIKNGESHNHPLILGQGKFLPGFEEAITGMKAGEKKEFALEIPKDWHEKTLAGKAFDFSVKMGLIQERHTPEAMDEFAKSMGDFDSLDALRANIREGLLIEKMEKEDQRIQSLIIENIAKEAEIDAPKMLVESEIEKMGEEMKSNIAQFGMKWEDYLLHIKKTEGDLRKDWQEDAGRRVRVALCLRAIANQERVTVSEEEIKEKTEKYLQRRASAHEAEKAIDSSAVGEYIRGILRNEKVFALLKSAH